MTGYESKRAAAQDKLAQPAQEPKSVTYKEVADAMNAMTKGTSGQQIAAEELGKLKLYTTPPQRPWVDLTDEEVELYWDWEDFQIGAGRSTILEMVRDIEAKLKEKNA